MSHPVNAHVQEMSHSGKGIHLERLKKNLLKELALFRRTVSLTLRIIFLTFRGFSTLFFGFKYIALTRSIITPSLVTFIVGKYCTLLPMYLVVPFTAAAYFIPAKIRTPILAILVLASLLIVLAI